MLVAGLGVAALLTAGVWLAMPDKGADPALAGAESPMLAANAPAPIVEPVAIPQQDPPLPAPAAPPIITPPAIGHAPAAVPPSPISTVEGPALPPAALPESRISTKSVDLPTSDASPETPIAAVTATPPPAVAAPAPKPAAMPAPKPEKAKPAKEAPKKADASPWLQRQPSGNYVVQLYATFQHSSATQFIAEHDLGSKANVVATLRDNKTWYVVVYGSYGDRARARAAIDGLPDAVQRLNPWVRKVADLKALQADR
jgi:septal ring-binding cell division protein DamX